MECESSSGSNAGGAFGSHFRWKEAAHAHVFSKEFSQRATNCYCYWSGGSEMRKNLQWNATKWYIKSDRGRRARSCQALEIIFVEMFQIKDKNKKTLHYVKFFCACVCDGQEECVVRGPDRVGQFSTRWSRSSLSDDIKTNRAQSAQAASQSGPTGAGQQFVFPTYPLTFFFVFPPLVFPHSFRGGIISATV